MRTYACICIYIYILERERGREGLEKAEPLRNSREQGTADRIVKEAMIFAGEAVAKYGKAQRLPLPFLSQMSSCVVPTSWCFV